jgi:phosphoribosylformylglycinamidine cyclo-ligase
MLGQALLAPTRLYVKPALAAIRAGGVHALAHITGGVSEAEMLKSFNCGIGMMLVVRADRAAALSGLLTGTGETVARIGRVIPGQGVTFRGRLA